MQTKASNSNSKAGIYDSQMQVQAISTIKGNWLEELKNTYLEDPLLQKLLLQYQEGALDPKKFHLHNGLFFYK
jgi:hypothetical protein